MVANDTHHYDNIRDNRFGSDVPDLNSLTFLLLASIILLVLTNKLSIRLSGVVGGASLQGIGGFGAAMITRAAATAISGAGMMAMSATAQVRGGALALKAAFESAQTAMTEESRSAGGSGGGFGDEEDTGSIDTSGEQPSGKSSSSGEAKVLLHHSLALAAWQVIWEAVWLTGLLSTRQ